ncbi:hypothetical protein TCAL_15285 [Tigriopus californicus]|uniref:PH domain-containing protein n=1 Tax=Tigriopus californicus TaxID=6832 RepID=A0A553PLY6_TIGCA|nr:hypothetical protein TCAL_15285 [Tigriopus californicus]
MCSNSDSVIVSSQTPEIKEGAALRYKKRIFGSNWRHGTLVLHQDSTLAWYPDNRDSKPDLGVLLKDAPEMIAAGQFSQNVPGRPDFPDGFDIKGAIAIGSKTKKEVTWLMVSSEEELIEWMKAISKTDPRHKIPGAHHLHLILGVDAVVVQGDIKGEEMQRGAGEEEDRRRLSPGGGGGGGKTTVIVGGDGGGRGYDGGGFGGGLGGFGTGNAGVGALGYGLGGWGMGYGFGPSVYGGFGYGGMGFGGGWGGGYHNQSNVSQRVQTYNNTTNNDNDTTNNITNEAADTNPGANDEATENVEPGDFEGENDVEPERYEDDPGGHEEYPEDETGYDDIRR